jgi:hypothetical protein
MMFTLFRCILLPSLWQLSPLEFVASELATKTKSGGLLANRNSFENTSREVRREAVHWFLASRSVPIAFTIAET